MTNQEAIDIIKTAVAEIEWEYPLDYAAAFDMAINTLKTQEPRVLSLSELEDTLETDTVVWLELRSNKMRQGHALVMSYSHAYGIMYIDTPFGDGPSQKIFNYAEYDTTWRCWSVKPDKEQREKEKWG